jgi:hypothetical protein
LKFLEGDRQKRTGWLLVIVSGAYALWFLKARLLTVGPPIAPKEWTIFLSMTVCFFIGTMNVRMAAEREERKKLDKSKNPTA